MATRDKKIPVGLNHAQLVKGTQCMHKEYKNHEPVYCERQAKQSGDPTVAHGQPNHGWLCEEHYERNTYPQVNLRLAPRA